MESLREGAVPPVMEGALVSNEEIQGKKLPEMSLICSNARVDPGERKVRTSTSRRPSMNTGCLGGGHMTRVEWSRDQ